MVEQVTVETHAPPLDNCLTLGNLISGVEIKIERFPPGRSRIVGCGGSGVRSTTRSVKLLFVAGFKFTEQSAHS
jgi:hypothetical protein